jgi:hypothetical protein
MDVGTPQPLTSGASAAACAPPHSYTSTGPVVARPLAWLRSCLWGKQAHGERDCHLWGAVQHKRQVKINVGGRDSLLGV